MAHTWVEYISLTVFGRHLKRFRHDQYIPARAIKDLGLTSVQLIHSGWYPSHTLPTGPFTMNVTGTFSIPTTRKSGAPLAPTDIDHFSLRRNGVEISKLAVPAGAQVSWTDTSPLTGLDTYEVFTITKDGFISDPSNDAVVTVATADAAAAITDLSATSVVQSGAQGA